MVVEDMPEDILEKARMCTVLLPSVTIIVSQWPFIWLCRVSNSVIYAHVRCTLTREYKQALWNYSK